MSALVSPELAPQDTQSGFRVDTDIIQAEIDAATTTANILNEWTGLVIRNVGSQSDDRLVEFARDAAMLETCAWKVRGACGAELKRRIKLRLTDGSIGKAMSALAKDIGVAPSTFADDTAIYQEFGDAVVEDKELGREHYRASLSADDPQAAIAMAHQKRSESSSYSVADFREDLKALSGGEPKEKVERGCWFHIHADPETKRAWQELRKHRNLEDEKLFKQMVLDANDHHKTKG